MDEVEKREENCSQCGLLYESDYAGGEEMGRCNRCLWENKHEEKYFGKYDD